MSNTLQDSINKLKTIFEKINNNKEELKLKIQKIFTKLRNELNNREDELLLEVDNQYDNIFFKENVIKDVEKLPIKIKVSLEKSKLIEEKENEMLNSLINDCINIENNIKEINIIYENIKKSNNSSDLEINFDPEEDGIKQFSENIKIFGKIYFIDKSKGLDKLSIIIKDNTNKNKLIIDWIKEKTNKSIIKFEKIFKMDENNSKGEDFHKCCDNKGPTLILISTTENKIFGGFTPLNWNNEGKLLIDESDQTFIFSLNLMKKYNIINKKEPAIRCHKNYGPYFGNCDFGLHKDLKEGEVYANSSCNFLSNNNLELVDKKGEKSSFNTKDFEVFKVIY